MNERIRSLADEAQNEVWGNNPFNGSPEFEGYELDTEKFAQLIVQECVDHAFHSGDDIAYLLKYFGVDE